MGEERRVCPTETLEPISSALGLVAHALEFAARPPNDIGIDPLQGRTQLRLVEVAVVGDPTADHRIVERGQLFQGLVTAVVQRPSLKRIDAYVIRWARRKYKRMVHQTKGGRDWFDRRRRKTPTLFAHWPLCHGSGRTSGAV